MKNIANATGKIVSRFLSAAHKVKAAKPVAESFCIVVRGVTEDGEYLTIADAEHALDNLSYRDRQHAAIYDQDGYCLSR